YKRTNSEKQGPPDDPIHPRCLNLNAVAEPEALPRMPADECVERWIESIRIVWDFRNGHKAFDKMIDQFDGEAVSPDPNDNRIEHVAEMLFHQEHFLPLVQLTFGLIGDSLEIARLAGQF